MEAAARILPFRKKCTSCGDVKRLDAFYVRKNRPSQYRSECKACCARFYDNPAYRIDPNEKKLRRRCSRCKVQKPLVDYQKNNRSKKGRLSFCKDCTKKRDRKRTYGLSHVDFMAMLKAQDSKCSICQMRVQARGWNKCSAVVDHDHKSGRLRSLLCRMCNVGIGHLGDDPERLEMAARYLRSHKKEP